MTNINRVSNIMKAIENHLETYKAYQEEGDKRKELMEAVQIKQLKGQLNKQLEDF